MISQRIAGTIVESGGNLTKALETAGQRLSVKSESMLALRWQAVDGLAERLEDLGHLNRELAGRHEHERSGMPGTGLRGPHECR